MGRLQGSHLAVSMVIPKREDAILHVREKCEAPAHPANEANQPHHHTIVNKPGAHGVNTDTFIRILQIRKAHDRHFSKPYHTHTKLHVLTAHECTSPSESRIQQAAARSPHTRTD